jgi:HlyD family secretion protein
MSMIPETTRSTKAVLWVSGLATLALLLLAIRYLTRTRVAVHVAHASYQDIVKTSSTNGKVEPINDFQAHAENSGVVQDIYVKLGEKVKAGQLLLRMDDADARSRLATAEANLQTARSSAADLAHGGTQDERNSNSSQLASARLQLEQDQSSLASLQKLAQTGAASPSEIAAVQHRIQADQNSIASIQQHSTHRYGKDEFAGAQARVKDAQAAVDAAQTAVANVVIRSPIGGSVYSIPVAQYDYVPAGDDLIYVADLTHLRVTAYFDEPEIGNLAAGQPVSIVWEAKPGKVWHGHISVAPTTIITYGTRNVGECLIDVDDAKGDLLPNTNVTVTVTTGEAKHALSVPREAVHVNSNQQTYVFRVEGGRLVETPVTVGLFNLVRAEIRSGLSDGDTVAISSAGTNQDLVNGMDITVVQ